MQAKGKKMFFKKKRQQERSISTLDEKSCIENMLEPCEFPSVPSVMEFLQTLSTSPLLKQAQSAFEQYPKSVLLNAQSRALLYFLTRFLKPERMLEIGTYKAGSSEIIARALRMNGKGELTTIDPYGSQRVPSILNTWPDSLKAHLDYLPLSSMECFMQLKEDQNFDLIFIDGDHSYEFALYDLNMAAKRINPGGVVILDNVEQTGVYWAVKSFLSNNTGWKELGNSIAHHDHNHPFSTMNPSFPETSFLLLQAPERLFINQWPNIFETKPVTETCLSGFEFHFSSKHGNGHVHAQIFFRSFWHGNYTHKGEPEQIMHITNFPLEKDATQYKLLLPTPLQSTHTPEYSYRTIELILTWNPENNAESLEMTSKPLPLVTI